MVRNAAFSKVRAEKFGHIVLDAHGANTMANFSSELSPQRGLLTICAASWSWEVRFRRRSAASVPGSGSSGRQWRRYRYGYSFADIHGSPGLTASVYIQLFSAKIGLPVRRWALRFRSKVRPNISGGDADLHGMTGETGMSVFQCHVSGALKHLDHGFILVRLDNASELLFLSVRRSFPRFHHKMPRKRPPRTTRGPLIELRPRYSIAIVICPPYAFRSMTAL